MNEVISSGSKPQQSESKQEKYPVDIADCISKPITMLREVTISPLDTGFVVRVGCQSVAVSTKKQLIEELTKYYINPTETEQRYYAGEFGDKNNK